MTTPKRPVTQIWQIYPRSAGRCIPHQLSIDALNTITSNFADLLADLIFGRSALQIYPLPVEHRCLEYHYTKLGRSHILHIYWQIYPLPHQLSIDALHTITPNMADLLTDVPPHLSIDALHTVTPNMADLLADLPPWSIKHRCLAYHYTKYGRSTLI